MPFYRGYIVGLHDRPIGVVQLDCVDDESAIKSAARLVDDHDVELWQLADARSAARPFPLSAIGGDCRKAAKGGIHRGRGPHQLRGTSLFAAVP